MDNIEPAEVAALRDECRRLTAALALAEQDRQLLLYEIHDGVLQQLTAAALLLEDAGQPATFATALASESHARGLRLLRESMAEVRQLLRGTLCQGNAAAHLAPALEKLVDWARTEWQLPAAFVTNCPELTVPASVEHLLLRIVQESLANVWKHAHASEVEVRLLLRDDGLELVIADNGVGFDPALVPAGHFGLESMRARAAALSAELVFDTAPHHGTRITLRLPQGVGLVAS